LHKLDVKFWGAAALSKIASMVGVPIMVDSMTQSRNRISYARILVEVNPADLPDEVLFEDEKGVVHTQQITYEWKPTHCDNCDKFGHDKKMCRQGLKPVRKEWVVKTKPAQAEANVAEPTTSQAEATNSVEVAETTTSKEMVKAVTNSMDIAEATKAYEPTNTEAEPTPSQADQWQTVTTRRRAQQLKDKPREMTRDKEVGARSPTVLSNG